MKILVAAAFALSTASAHAAALDFQDRCHDAFANREERLMGACMGWTAGVADGLDAAGVLCAPPGVRFEQIRMMVHAYVRAHPEQLNQPMASLIKRALVPAWSCRSSKGKKR